MQPHKKKEGLLMMTLHLKHMLQSQEHVDRTLALAFAMMMVMLLSVAAAEHLNNPNHGLFDTTDTAHPDSVEMLPQIMRQHYQQTQQPAV